MAQSDNGSSATQVQVRVLIEALLDVAELLTLRAPQADTVLQLASRGPKATTQVQVVVDALNTAAELTLRISADDAEVVSVPSEPIAIAADGNAVQRSVQIGLVAREAGETMVSIAVADGVNVATVALRVVVTDLLRILSPSDGTHIALVRGDGTLATTQIEVFITQTQTNFPVMLNLQLESVIPPPVFIPTTSLILAAPDDGSIQRMAEFTLFAAEAGETTVTLVASDWAGNRDAVIVRVSVARVNEVCETCLVPDTVIVPAGSFAMGSSAGEPNRNANEGPQHQVSIDYAFAVGKYELTRGQYRAFVDASGHDAGRGFGSWLEPGFARRGFTQSDTHPVVNVSGEDAEEYLAWLSKETGEEWRLLSEAEWEYAARAGTTTSYAFGDEINKTQARFLSSTGTVAVGSYAANAFGLYDMHGNVSEWVEDCWHENYTNAPVDGSAWLSDCVRGGALRVLRGGSWFDFLSGNLRSAARFVSDTRTRSDLSGFRVARIISP